MRVTPILAALPALAVAQEQIPLAERLQGWFNKAKSYLPAPTPVAPLKVSEQIIQKSVTPFNLDNWQSNLEPASHPQDWFVFVTGGNKTCFGQCERADRSFNVSREIKMDSDWLRGEGSGELFQGVCVCVYVSC